MQYKDLEKLVKLIETSHFDEFEWQSKSEKIRLKKTPAPAAGGSVSYVAAPAMSAVPAAAPAAGAMNISVEAQKPAASAASNTKKITSPFVGTFYEAPAPDAPKYTDVGRTFKKGDVLCIVEAMKIMNEIEADFSGRVVQVLAKSGQAVQYGQPLFEVEAQ